MRQMRAYAPYAASVLVATLGCGCGPRGSSAPERELPWPVKGKGAFELGAVASGLYRVPVPPDQVETWAWKNNALVQEAPFALPAKSSDVTPLADERYVCFAAESPETGSSPLVLSRRHSGEVLASWVVPGGWWCPGLALSPDGAKIGVAAERSSARRSAIPEPGNPTRKVGIVDLTTRALHWVASWRDDGTGGFGEVAVSNGGGFIAVSGWENGLAVVDVAGKKMLWHGRPTEAVGIRRVAFGPDGTSVYAGDSGGGGIYEYETKTGVIKRKWMTDDSYGGRMPAMTVSPDGKWLATAVVPGGNVFLFDLKAGKRVALFRHSRRGLSLLCFSPDSTRLASYGAGKIKIWRLPTGTGRSVEAAGTH